MSQRPKDGDTGVNSFMLIFIFVLFGGVALYTIFGMQGLRVAPDDVDRAVRMNLRRLTDAASQTFIDQGSTSVRSADLIGTNSSQYVRAPFATVAGETYTPLIIKGQPVTASGVAGTRTITYAP